MPVTPFVVGQWVRGEKFYGRDVLIEEILRGPRNWLWLLGTRRIGKTSLLKQIEHLTSRRRPDLGYFPIFWDFQGASDPEELHMGFSDALLDAEDRLEELGIEPGEVEDDNLFRSLGRLRRKLRPKGTQADAALRRSRGVDQAEREGRLVTEQAAPRHAVLRGGFVRSWPRRSGYGRSRTSAVIPHRFCTGSAHPLFIHTLSDEAATALICQANLPNDSRPVFDDDAVEFLRSQCDNHPYLIQLVAKRYVECGNLQESVDQVATDPMVSYFFSVDFEMLSETERNIIRIIAENSSSTSNSILDSLPVDADRLSGLLYRLEHLGYIRRNEQQRFVLMNSFFRRWFKGQTRAGMAR